MKSQTAITKNSDPLFEPITVGSLRVKNRIAFAPTGTQRASPDGGLTDENLCYYIARAKGGAGWVTIEHSLCTYRHFRGGCIPAFDKIAFLPRMKDLSSSIKRFGARAVVQLSLGLGRQTSARRAGTELVAPSPIPVCLPKGSAHKIFRDMENITWDMPRQLTAHEILELEEDFKFSTQLIAEAGFDGIEIHAAHGYLLAQFLSPVTNKRKDSYGGSEKKRLTLVLNLLRKAQDVAPKKFAIGIRISGDEHVAGGLSIEESIRVVKTLEREGIDFVHLSSGCMERMKYMFPDREGVILPEATAFKQALKIPVICPNIHRPATARQVILKKQADIISLSRSLLADPEWPNKVKRSQEEDIVECTFCLKCLKSIFSGIGARCSVNPKLGMERFFRQYSPIE